MEKNDMPTTRIRPVDKAHGVLALGCWAFGGAQWGGQEDADSLAAMAAALEGGMNHFDTAEGYGSGRSERLVGQFVEGNRDRIFLATKGFPREPDQEAIVKKADASLARLRTDAVDLYYIHWPLKGKDMRPYMEGMERLRQTGKIRAVGVSNFSVEQMEQVSQVGRIDAHQLCYNLFWRWPERDVIPYCRQHGIALVTYSSIAQGILTGKFPRSPEFREGDSRPGTVLFEKDVWPHVYAGVERLKALASDAHRPLADLAIRWVVAQPGVTSVIVGARNAEQARRNAAAMAGEIAEDVFQRMSRIAEEVMAHVPDVGNMWRFYP